jgi:hypothetical protein
VYHPIRRIKVWLAVAGMLLGLLAPVFVPRTVPAFASYGISQHMGWDACGIGSTANADAFWVNTPYWNMGLYLGGSSYGTGCTRWSSSQVSTLRSQGWKFMPLWVGPQAPCTGFSSRFSYDGSTAFAQGRNEALTVYNVISQLGWDTTNAPVIYDLEAFDTTNSSCVNAAKQFISGWTYQMHIAPAQKAGVYGSSCASDLAAYASVAYVPDFIDGANWSGVKSTATIACVPSGYWVYHQRHKQYRGDHYETWNGVTLNVDSDCSDGPVYPGPDNYGNTQGCV